MRILHVVGGLDRGGAETWLVQTLRCIDRAKYQFDFLVHTERPGAYDNEVRAMGSQIVPCLSPSNAVRYSMNFLRILRRFGPYDCVHCHLHHFSGLPLSLARFAGIPLRIVQSHTVDIETQPGQLRRGYLRVTRRLIHASATKGIAVSQRAADSLFPSSWRQTDRWRVMPLGIDLTPFRVAVDRREVRKEFGIPIEAFVVGHAGRFVEPKNHVFVIRIAEALVSKMPNAMFLLLGDGPLLPEIRNKVAAMRLERSVIFAGVRTDVARLMKGAMDVFVLPSRYEGLGLVVMEAQAAGLHCVVSDVVPEEADAGMGHVHRLSLDEPPVVWAAELSCARGCQARPPAIHATRSIEASTRQLLHFYDSWLPVPTRVGTR